MSQQSSRSRPNPIPPWLILAIFAAVIVVSYWQTRPAPRVVPDGPVIRSGPTAPERTRDENLPKINPAHRPIDAEVAKDPEETAPTTPKSKTLIEHQTIRDLNGHVVFEGTIDLAPTLARIERGDKGSHRNDGTTFQNRERRLPSKPSGYYKEYVHPTPKSSGPGPQRVIVGRDGDVWYTPDHYKTFVRVR